MLDGEEFPGWGEEFPGYDSDDIDDSWVNKELRLGL